MDKSLIKIVFTDLDGTLLNSRRKIGTRDLAMLQKLGQKNILRVIATGRNLFSLSKVLPSDFPVDYVVFSTGAGILEWPTRQLLYARNLKEEQICHVSKVLMKHKINFMLHKKVPDNHQFYYFHHDDVMADFQRRLDLYMEHAQKINNRKIALASQFLAIFETPEKFQFIKEQLKNVTVVRATSPLDYKSVWMEIFHHEVSKKMGCQWLCNHLSIDSANTISFGNDYNDLDMLEWTAQSFVVDNGIELLKQKYPTTKSNDDNGFSEILSKMID
jgi:Cof subfamily protein (haloacid dehalogenase superfamily)